MFHNIKADIIYYKTPTDFELEFNLCGCCRMRLLSDKVQDKKSFVNSLARAVSRSNVILSAGTLFGEDGLIKTVADAINTTVEPADNQTFGIVSDEKIEIIKGSTPLITPEGYFGGCIIESGPQVMILLSDNKNIRKAIMKNLIHPYIEELYSAEASTIKEDTDLPNDQVIIEDNDSNEIPKETELPEVQQIQIVEEIQEELNQPEETETEDNSEIVIADDEIYEDEEAEEDDDDETIDLFFEPTKLDRKTVERYTKDYIAHTEMIDDYSDNDYCKSKNPRKNGLSLSVFIISLILLLVIVILCYCIFLVPAKTGISPVDNLQDIFNTLFG